MLLFEELVRRVFPIDNLFYTDKENKKRKEKRDKKKEMENRTNLFKKVDFNKFTGDLNSLVGGGMSEEEAKEMKRKKKLENQKNFLAKIIYIGASGALSMREIHIQFMRFY